MAVIIEELEAIDTAVGILVTYVSAGRDAVHESAISALREIDHSSFSKEVQDAYAALKRIVDGENVPEAEVSGLLENLKDRRAEIRQERQPKTETGLEGDHPRYNNQPDFFEEGQEPRDQRQES